MLSASTQETNSERNDRKIIKKKKKEKEFFQRLENRRKKETHWSGRPPRAGFNFITFGSNLWTCEIYMYIEKNLLSVPRPPHRVTPPVSNSSLETNWSVIHFFHSSFLFCCRSSAGWALYLQVVKLTVLLSECLYYWIGEPMDRPTCYDFITFID